jgi:hypothetical protein
MRTVAAHAALPQGRATVKARVFLAAARPPPITTSSALLEKFRELFTTARNDRFSGKSSLPQRNRSVTLFPQTVSEP